MLPDEQEIRDLQTLFGLLTLAIKDEMFRPRLDEQIRIVKARYGELEALRSHAILERNKRL